MRRLKILQLTTQSDGSRRLYVCDFSDSLNLMTTDWSPVPITAYAPAEPWNANWKVGDVIEVDAREKTSANGNRYLSFYPTASLANQEPREMADQDAVRALHLFIDARLNTIERKINNLLGIDDGQPNFSPDA